MKLERISRDTPPCVVFDHLLLSFGCLYRCIHLFRYLPSFNDTVDPFFDIQCVVLWAKDCPSAYRGCMHQAYIDTPHTSSSPTQPRCPVFSTITSSRVRPLGVASRILIMVMMTKRRVNPERVGRERGNKRPFHSWGLGMFHMKREREEKIKDRCWRKCT